MLEYIKTGTRQTKAGHCGYVTVCKKEQGLFSVSASKDRATKAAAKRDAEIEAAYLIKKNGWAI